MEDEVRCKFSPTQGRIKRGDTKKEMDFEEIVTSVRRIIMFSIRDSVELTLIMIKCIGNFIREGFQCVGYRLVHSLNVAGLAWPAKFYLLMNGGCLFDCLQNVAKILRNFYVFLRQLRKLLSDRTISGKSDRLHLALLATITSIICRYFFRSSPFWELWACSSTE